jgi:RiboL-PSP-HEPN
MFDRIRGGHRGFPLDFGGAVPSPANRKVTRLASQAKPRRTRRRAPARWTTAPSVSARGRRGGPGPGAERPSPSGGMSGTGETRDAPRRGARVNPLASRWRLASRMRGRPVGRTVGRKIGRGWSRASPCIAIYCRPTVEAQGKMPRPEIDLSPVDELIQVRQAQHGGFRGAPPVVGGARVGAAINKSCILMLSALLQGYVEDVFLYFSERLFANLRTDENLKRYRTTIFRWGNPSSQNITSLFMRLGIVDVFDGLTWQRTRPETIKAKLDQINKLRNKIAHGQSLPQSVSLAQVRNLRDFVENFGERFARHVRGKFPSRPRARLKRSRP